MGTVMGEVGSTVREGSKSKRGSLLARVPYLKALLA